MRFGVGFLQSFDRDVRVNLRRRQARMAEQRLDAAQIRPTIEHVRREAVSKFMRADRDRNRSVAQIPFEDEPNGI